MNASTTVGVPDVVQADSLRKVYPTSRGRPDFVAVDGLSFTLPRGGSLGIVGESGAGKTTTASMLMGFEQPTSGTILVDGKPRPASNRRHDRKRRARQIQIVFQDPYSSLDPHQSVGAAVEEVLGFHFGGSSTRQRASQLLDMVGISEQTAQLRPRSLSGGQRQRIAIARALATEPTVLILDESVAALDVSIQAQVLNLLADIRKETGTAYILISHDLGVVRYATDAVIVMQMGKVVESGRTSAVLDNPQHPYTRQLRDAVPRPGWTAA
jgi:ABC-type glutathione transport system ATPase component